MNQAITAGFLTMERGNNDTQNFRKLLSGRIDLYPQEILVGYATLDETFSTDESAHITHTHNPFLETENHLLFPKSRAHSEALLTDFNAGLKQLKQNGRYRQLIGTSPPF